MEHFMNLERLAPAHADDVIALQDIPEAPERKMTDKINEVSYARINF